MKWKRVLGAAVLFVFVFTAGCGITGSKDKKDIPEKPNSDTQVQEPQNQDTPPVNPQPTKEEVEVALYFSDDQAMYIKPEKRTVTKAGKPLAEILIEELIKGPQDKKLGVTIPPEAKLISLEISDGVAFVNFSKEVKTKHWGGSAGETMTVQSIVHTLTQLPEIEKVQFLIEGEKEESIWGHGYTGEPIAPNKDIVKK